MKLHQDIKLFSDTLRAASQQLGIKLEFVIERFSEDVDIAIIMGLYAKADSSV